eukprot:UN4234
MWGRTDGVPLLMRVLHVLQLKVNTTDPRMRGKFLYQTWAQAEDGLTRSVNRLMSAKLCARDLPFNRQRFVREAKEVVKEDPTYLVDPCRETTERPCLFVLLLIIRRVYCGGAEVPTQRIRAASPSWGRPPTKPTQWAGMRGLGKARLRGVGGLWAFCWACGRIQPCKLAPGW